jgi:hypothetical protein
MAVALASRPPQRERTKELRDGAVLIAGSRTQTEALETLLAASSAITPACGLMILRGAQAIGWNCHGLTSLDNFKRTTMDCTAGVAATVIGSCTGMATQGSELDPALTTRLGLENSAQILLVPVLLKERVAALLIALSQQGDDLAGLELLVQVAQLALDLQAYRKASPRPVQQPHPVEPHRPPASPEPQRHETAYAAAAATGIRTAAPSAQPERVYTTSMMASAAIAQSTTAAQVADAAVSETVAHPQSFTPVLDEAHEKARRFAKLLVEEIKLYNQTKVAEGRARGDLYSRLREDIEKSRAAYHKRYGDKIVDIDYFTQELMRILADNDRTVMGPGFPG